jgi:hypothetical protein
MGGLGGAGPRRVDPARRGLARLRTSDLRPALACLRLRTARRGSRLGMLVLRAWLSGRWTLLRRRGVARPLHGAWGVAVSLSGGRTLCVLGPPVLLHQRRGPERTQALRIGLLQLLPENHPRVGRAAADGRRAVGRRGLPRGGNVVYPDPAHPGWRTMIGRDVTGIGGVPPTLGARILRRQRGSHSEHKDKQAANHQSSRTDGNGRSRRNARPVPPDTLRSAPVTPCHSTTY